MGGGRSVEAVPLVQAARPRRLVRTGRSRGSGRHRGLVEVQCLFRHLPYLVSWLCHRPLLSLRGVGNLVYSHLSWAFRLR